MHCMRPTCELAEIHMWQCPHMDRNDPVPPAPPPPPAPSRASPDVQIQEEGRGQRPRTKPGVPNTTKRRSKETKGGIPAPRAQSVTRRDWLWGKGPSFGAFSHSAGTARAQRQLLR